MLLLLLLANPDLSRNDDENDDEVDVVVVVVVGSRTLPLLEVNELSGIGVMTCCDCCWNCPDPRILVLLPLLDLREGRTVIGLSP